VPPNTSATGGYLAPSTTPPPSDTDFARQLSNLIAGVTGIAGSLVRPRWQPEPPPIPKITENWVAIGATAVDPADRGTASIIHVGRDYVQDRLARGESLPVGSDPASNDELLYDGRDDLTEHEMITILASVYGPASGGYASLLRSGLMIDQNWELAHSRGMVLMEVGTIRHVPEMIDGRWYDRRDVEIKIRRQVDRSYPVLNILSAQGELRADRLPSTAEPTQDWTTENVNG
jgi:hypothetical protein